jgi:two-component system, LytTR family, response regulator
MKLRCIAIDDEPLALDLMESYISKIPYLQLKGLYNNALQALELVCQQEIDLIFLDINMPDVLGIDFVKGMKKPPMIVFVTAHEQYALQGFEVNAIDYLLKPVSFERFMVATEKAYSNFMNTLPAYDFIFVKSEHNVIKIELKNIHYIEGYKDYVKIITSDPKSILTITTFKAMEEMLPPTFIRVHKSFIISVDKIISIRRGRILVKDKYLPIGDSYKDAFNKIVVEGRLT